MGSFYWNRREPRSFLAEGYIVKYFDVHDHHHIKLEWGWHRRMSVGLDVGNWIWESPTIALNLLFLSVYLTLNIQPFIRVRDWMQKKWNWGGSGAKIFQLDGFWTWPIIQVEICPQVNCSSSTDPWWRRGVYWNTGDLLLGRYDCDDTKSTEVDVVIPMPEGCYKAKAVREHRIWTRSRLPFFGRKTRDSWWFTIENGIPCAGKGENSWDCGDDGTYGCGSDKESVEEAIGDVVGLVLRSRRKYGQASWLVNVPPHMAPPKLIDTSKDVPHFVQDFSPMASPSTLKDIHQYGGIPEKDPMIEVAVNICSTPSILSQIPDTEPNQKLIADSLAKFKEKLKSTQSNGIYDHE